MSDWRRTPLPLVLLGIVASLSITACQTTQASCGAFIRQTSYQTLLSRNDSEQGSLPQLVVYVKTEEYGHGAAPYPTSFQWGIYSMGSIPQNITGTVDTIGAAAPLLELPPLSSTVQLEPQVAGPLVTALLARRGVIHLSTPAGIIGSARIEEYAGGQLSPACIE